MRRLVLVLLMYSHGRIVLCSNVQLSKSSEEFGTRLVSGLRDDVNLDLSEDEEYEDLRAELLAYHTALASLATSRRSLLTTPCWNLGGICIDSKLCTGFRSLTEVPGCKDKLRVCCFAWNRYNVRDMREHGIQTLALPWSLKEEFGGKGLNVVENKKKTKKKSKKMKTNDSNKTLRSQVVALILNGK
ncbi:unnamed protein product, partial [Iphiclides podalirius]